MAKILGLDLGTNSIGWAVVEKFQHSSTFNLLDKGVHIFSEGVKNEKGNESSKAAERTRFRSARRLKFRRKLRKYETLKVLRENGMCPVGKDELEKWYQYTDPKTGKVKRFKYYPSSEEFLNWLKTDNQDSEEERKKGIKNPYYFRAKAIERKLSPLELGRALYHLAQRRGFLSNRFEITDDVAFEEVKREIKEVLENENEIASLKYALECIKAKYIPENDENDEEQTDKRIIQLFKSVTKNLRAENNKRGKNKIVSNEPLTIEYIKEDITTALNRKENLGEVASEIKDLSKEREEAKCKTIGQYFYTLYQQNLKEGEKKVIRNRYTAREQHYLEEFELICKVQGLVGINDKEEATEKRYTGLVQQLYKAIFYQRPLKSQKGLVGKCTLEKNKPRCPVSHPDFEEFRALQFINNIAYKKSKIEDWNSLDSIQRESILPLFLRKSSPNFSFVEIREKLTPKNEDWQFNYSDKTSVSGCPTIAQLKNIFGENWKKLKIKHIAIHKKKNKINENAEIDIYDVWHVLFSFERAERLQSFAKSKLGLDDNRAKKFSNIHIKREYASLSLRAIKKILPHLIEGEIFSHAVLLANMQEVLGKEIWEKEENKKLAKEKLPLIIKTYNEEKKKINIVNDLIYYFNENYSNADKAYTLTKKDKEEVLQKIKEYYGEKTFEKLNNEKQKGIIAWIEANYEQQLRKKGNGRGEFMKIARLDDVIIEELKNIFGEENIHPDKLFHPSDIDIYHEQDKLLGSPIIASIKNPMAMRALHQLRKLINTLIKEGTIIPEETRIHIELARELNDMNKRKAIKKYQDERDEERKGYKEDIKKLYKEECQKDIEPTEDEILKFQLRQEQKGKCIYTGATISICDFIGTPHPKYDIEHTLPRRYSQDNSQMNKTLANDYYNRQVKKNLLPIKLPNYKESKELTLGGQKIECQSILNVIGYWKIKAEGFEEQYNKCAKPRGLETKEQKDKRIQEKHYYKMHWDYWKGKYERFTMEEIKKGFKSSQKVDTGIITKYARAYLYSLFPSVISYKGELVAEFRRRWGLQNDYEKKERINHIHHCVDAVTIACMTKQNYDLLARAWESEDAGDKKEAKRILEEAKPWKFFTEKVLAIENEVLISHHTTDNIKKQTRKKLRKRGKIVHKAIYELDAIGKPKRDSSGKKIIKEFDYEKEDGNLIPARGKKLSIESIANKKEGEDYFSAVNKETGELNYYEFVLDKNKQKVYKKTCIYQRGDTVRGSLHQETFYGAIKTPLRENGKIKRDENSNIIFEKDDKGKDKVDYVIRKELSKLKAGDVDDIVDENIKKIIIQAVKDKKISFKKNSAVVNGTIWQNFEKKIEIKKVRCYAYPTELLDIKEHRDKKSTHQHKWQYHVQNDTNYGMAIYEGKDKKGNTDRVCELINTLDAGTYYKMSNKNHRKQYPLAPEKHKETGYAFKTLLTKGQMVLLYIESPKEIWDLQEDKRLERLYIITGLDKDGIKLYYHQESRATTEVLAFMNEIITQQNTKAGKVDKEGKTKQSKLTSPKGGDVIGKHKEFPYIKFKPNGFNALVQGIDFKISTTGEIEQLKSHAQANPIL